MRKIQIGQNKIQKSQIDELFNAQRILERFRSEFHLDQHILPLSYIRKFMNINQIRFKQISFRSKGFFHAQRKQQLTEYSFKLLSYIKEKVHLLFIDETTFSHQQRNQDVGNKRQNKNTRRLLIQIIISAYLDVLVHKVFNAIKSAFYLQKLIQEAERFYNSYSFVVILVNCPIHQGNLVKERYLNKINSLFQAPYSLKLYPIEMFGNYLKNKQKKKILMINSNQLEKFTIIQKKKNNIYKKHYLLICKKKYKKILKFTN